MYSSQFCIKKLWSPEFITSPCFKTKILSALCIVDNLWAIISVVLFFVRLDIAYWTISSESESNDEVASSSNIIGACLRKALAIEILCFWPPDNLTPFSPTKVSYLPGSFSINSSAAANLQASVISFSEAF